jgi:hypothetical protein
MFQEILSFGGTGLEFGHLILFRISISEFRILFSSPCPMPHDPALAVYFAQELC